MSLMFGRRRLPLLLVAVVVNVLVTLFTCLLWTMLVLDHGVVKPGLSVGGRVVVVAVFALFVIMMIYLFLWLWLLMLLLLLLRLIMLLPLLTVMMMFVPLSKVVVVEVAQVVAIVDM